MNVFFLLIVLFLRKIHSFDICEIQKTSDECIKRYDCIWCTQDNVAERCKSRNLNLTSWCLQLSSRISSNKWNIEENREFSPKISHFIQIRPQNISTMAMRPEQPLEFIFSFEAAEDYPVDLYLLMAGSMESMRRRIAYQSENIFNMMRNKTSNVFLGMGTFGDKNTASLTETNNTPCFKNHLKLTDNIEVFKKVVTDTSFGSNEGEEKGTFDALAQVIACKEEIGWRSESRKIIIVLTGDLFHSAGDGKWSGIVKPYDGKCYTRNGIYTKELDMDYPSVSIINKLAADEQMTIIFAVTKDVSKVYKTLTNFVSESSMVIYDTDKSDDEFVQILQSKYEERANNLKINVYMDSHYRNFFNISTTPDCISTNSEECILKRGETKTFLGTIEMLQYINDTDNISIDLVAEGIKEKINVNIKF